MPPDNHQVQTCKAPSMLELFVSFVRDVMHETRGVRGRAAMFTLLGAVMEGVGLMLLLPLVNIVTGAGVGSGIIDRAASSAVAWIPTSSAAAKLSFLLAGFAAIMAVRAWAILNRDISLAKLQAGFIETLRIRIVGAMARAEWRVLAQLRHGRISHVLSNDIRNCGLAAHLTLQAVIAAMILAVQMTLALLLSPAVALIVFTVLVIGGLSLRPALRRSRQLGTELTESGFGLTDNTNQFLGGLKLAFSQELQGSFAAEYRQTLAYGVTREVSFARQRSISQLALTSLAAATAGAALLLGFQVFGTSPSALIALLVVLARMSGPAAQIQQNLQYVAHSLPAYEQIRSLESELLTAAQQQREHDQPEKFEGFAGDIVFSGVSYEHGACQNQPAGVSEINLQLRFGEFVGITGASGAGKTTFVDLLVGLLAPDEGAISINGISLDRSTVSAWRRRVSYVSQEPYLFNDSIAGNLRWAHPESSDDDMWRALKLAGADALVAGLAQGIDTIVGERGSRLSGGERQRIALARALIRKPALLVLDEATNAIDVPAERAILQHLASLSPRPTVLMVAHREQSLALCDRMLSFEAGRVVEVDLNVEPPKHGR